MLGDFVCIEDCLLLLFSGTVIAGFELIFDCGSIDPTSLDEEPEGVNVVFAAGAGTTGVAVVAGEMAVDAFSYDEAVPLRKRRLLTATRITVVVVHHRYGDRPEVRLVGISSSRIGFIFAQPCSGVIL